MINKTKGNKFKKKNNNEKMISKHKKVANDTTLVGQHSCKCQSMHAYLFSTLFLCIRCAN